MADRDPLRQQAPKFRDLGSGVKLYKLPLLPYERQLIETLGCTEEEYRRFAYLASKRGAARPAEYAHIPDVQAILGDPVTTAVGFLAVNTAKSATTVVLTNLAIGLALTAASVLLAPKPRAFSAQQGPDNRVTRRRLGGRTGQDRFSPTVGFDTQADIADYASPIPIIFGKYTGTTGGIVASPALVWSRAFSLGTQQAVKQMFVVGEQGLGDGIARPDLNGIFLGSTPLDASYAHMFAFYWKRNSNNSEYRIKATNWAYGSRGTLSSGDIEENDDIFLCPTGRQFADTGFSAAHSQTANLQFGCYGAIPNGTNYRVNWRTISIPRLEDIGDDPDNHLLMERVKIAGDYGIITGDRQDEEIRAQGQRGVGRNYGRRMGITSLNGAGVTDEGSTPKEVRKVEVGNTAVFSIAPGALPKDLYYRGNQNTSVDDINSAISSSRRAADDYLQIGETVMIGFTTWVVRSRSIPVWQEDKRQDITLECVEVFEEGEAAKIGLISERMLGRDFYNDDDGATDTYDGLNMNAGAGFYPLMRVNFGIVRNTRACEVTEIGIRSQVWSRANGLCNFATVPSPSELQIAERNRISLETGTMNIYFKRTSVWTIFLRPAGTDANGAEFQWQPLGGAFCVTGETPQDQYNFIRIGHPEPRQYEFKFVPKNGADVAQRMPEDRQLIRLNAKTNETVSDNFVTAHGTFNISAVGEYVTIGDLLYNTEMATDPAVRSGSTDYEIPSSIEVERYLPDTDEESARALTVGFYDRLPQNPLGQTQPKGRRAVLHYELFGRAGSQNQVASAQRTVNLGDGRSITLRFNGIVDDQYPKDAPNFKNEYEWSLGRYEVINGVLTKIEGIEVVSSSVGFNTNQVFNFSIPVSASNPRNVPYGLTTVGLQIIVLSTDQTFADSGVSGGRESAWEYELLGDAQNYAIGQTNTASFTVDSSSGGLATINATGVVTERSNTSLASFPGQTKAWDVTYNVEPLLTYGTWERGALLDNNAVVSPGNPFYTEGKTVGIELRVMDLQTVQTPPGFSGERVFENFSQVTDLSVYGDLLSKSNQSSPEHEIMYVNESVSNATVPHYENLTLCGLALKSSRSFASLDQLRFWLADGIPVKRFLASDSGTIGPSNKFVDLIYHLLTDTTAGAGNVVSSEMIRTEDFASTAQFLESNGLFFDGAIDAPTNIRQFIADTAPFFLCNFVISDGKFSLVPALPTDVNGDITNQAVPIKQIFTAGNIIEGSFSVEYLSSEERKDFQALMRYREERRNQLPEEKTLVVRFKEAGSDAYPIESFDMTQFCTSQDHAFLVAKYFLSLRRRVTHTVKFRTSPFGLSLAPGDYIRVITEASPYQPANNGTIADDGTIVSARELADGTYRIVHYGVEFDDVALSTMTVADGKVVETSLYDQLFSVVSQTVSANVYMVEQLTLGEDGMVDVVATEFPTRSDESFNSVIADEVASNFRFITEPPLNTLG
jgi:hypothetical protein